MRVIKFRAWDGKTMLVEWELKNIPQLVMAYLSNNDPSVIIMQYTGLKDKNNKEIYEGDIISEKVHSEPSNWASPLVHKSDNYIEIGFINGSFCNAYTEIPLSDFLVSFVSHEIRYEIIGNIYETPELLDGKI